MAETPIYAKNTKISSEKSEQDIRKLLKRFGANKTVIYDDDEKFGFVFEYKNLRVRIVVNLPDPNDFTFVVRGARGKEKRSETEKQRAWERECDRRWRAMKLIVQSKLVSVTEGVRTFEEEFLHDILLPNGQTVGEYVAPQIQQSYLTGKMPPLLPGISEK